MFPVDGDAEDTPNLTTDVKGIVVGTREDTITAPSWPVDHPFEACWQLGDAATYCWSRSQYDGGQNLNYCGLPKGGSTVAPWLPIETEDVVKSCDTPCQKLY